MINSWFGDDIEIAGLTDLLIEDDGGFLSRAGGVTDDLIDLSDQEVFGNEAGG